MSLRLNTNEIGMQISTKPGWLPRGFLQQEGVDSNETNAVVVDSTSISKLLSIANQKN